MLLLNSHSVGSGDRRRLYIRRLPTGRSATDEELRGLAARTLAAGGAVRVGAACGDLCPPAGDRPAARCAPQYPRATVRGDPATALCRLRLARRGLDARHPVSLSRPLVRRLLDRQLVDARRGLHAQRARLRRRAPRRRDDRPLAAADGLVVGAAAAERRRILEEASAEVERAGAGGGGGGGLGSLPAPRPPPPP